MKEPTMLRLMYFPVNAAWAYVFGRDVRTMQPLTVLDGPLMLQTREQAIELARRAGLAVDRRGNVTVTGRLVLP